MARPTVYLAGPMVFYPEPDAIFAAMREMCRRYGLRGVSPFDNQADLKDSRPGHGLAVEIVRADIALMRKVDAGLFCLDGFRRSPEMDPGTAFEIGFMHALGKPLAGWTSDPREYPVRVRDYLRELGLPAPGEAASGGAGATSGAFRDADGVLIHSEGCYQNAMTQVGIELSGGRVFAATDWAEASEAGIANLAKVISDRPVRPDTLA